MVQAPKCPARPGAPVGCDSRSIQMHKAGGRRGKLRSRGFRTPESEVGTSTDAPVALSGVLRGWADCERGPALWGRSRTGGSSPKRAFAYFSPVRKVGRPGGENPKARGFAGILRQKVRAPQREYLLSPPSYLKPLRPKAGERARPQSPRFIHKSFIKGSQFIKHFPRALCYDNSVRKKSRQHPPLSLFSEPGAPQKAWRSRNSFPDKTHTRRTTASRSADQLAVNFFGLWGVIFSAGRTGRSPGRCRTARR